MTYQVKIQLDFEYEPLEEDVFAYIKDLMHTNSLDYEIIPPYEDPFDDPAAVAKHVYISRYYRNKNQ